MVEEEGMKRVEEVKAAIPCVVGFVHGDLVQRVRGRPKCGLRI